MLKTPKIIQLQIEDLIATGKPVSVMLTGGRSAALLYNEWKKLPNFKTLSNVTFYFGDERCMPPDHPESNYGMAMKTLFSSGVPKGCSVERMIGESEDLVSSAELYAEQLPNIKDILLLGIGDDGHIASLFPHSTLLHEQK
jgi:6-phosphogluconolactonase